MSDKSFLDFLNGPRVSLVFPSTMEILLGYLREYAITLEKLLKINKAELKGFYDEIQRSAESSSDLGGFDEKLFVAEILFPRFLRSSFFLTAYSLLEDGLRKRCLCIESSKSLPLSVGDMSSAGGYIVQYRKYLEKVAKISFANVEKEWKKLRRYNELRNLVIHCQGHLGLDEKRHSDLKRFIKDNPHWLRLEVCDDVHGEESHYEIIFEQEFCKDAVDTLERFFCGLDTQLPEGCKDLESHFGFSP